MGSIYVSQHCTPWQQCVSVSCSAVCATVSSGEETALFELASNVSECLSTRACEHDAECPSGKCYHAVASGPGTCSAATTDSPCLSAADCFSGICVLTSNGGRCEDGKLEQPCGSAADCQGKLCVAAGVCFVNDVVPLQGPLIPAGATVNCRIHTGNQCQNGLLGSFCDAPADCQSAICVRLPGGLGRCTDGSPPSACNTQADCKVGSCVLPLPTPPATTAGDLPLGWCTNGGPGDFCGSSADCKAGGTCYATGNEPASCRAGVAHDPCRTDAECQSHICVQLKGAGSTGECTSGSTGDACANDDDCDSQICLLPPNDQVLGFTYHCSSGAAGDPCWDAGDCLSGNCGPPPTGKDGGLCLAP